VRNNLLNRLEKISEKIAPEETYMIFVAAGESVGRKVKSFNEKHKSNINPQLVEHGRCFPFKNGHFFIGKDWSMAFELKKWNELKQNKT